MACEIIWEERGILFKHTGTVTEQEVAEANDRVYGDKRFEEITYQISDYTEVTDIQITPRGAKIIATLDKSSLRWIHSKMRMAIVTKDEGFIPIVNTYFEQFKGTELQGRIFETLDKAYDWVKSGNL